MILIAVSKCERNNVTTNSLYVVHQRELALSHETVPSLLTFACAAVFLLSQIREAGEHKAKISRAFTIVLGKLILDLN